MSVESDMYQPIPRIEMRQTVPSERPSHHVCKVSHTSPVSHSYSIYSYYLITFSTFSLVLILIVISSGGSPNHSKPSYPLPFPNFFTMATSSSPPRRCCRSPTSLHPRWELMAPRPLKAGAGGRSGRAFAEGQSEQPVATPQNKSCC